MRSKKRYCLKLDTSNICLYTKLINDEGKELQVKGDSIYIDKLPVKEYTVKQNYYFVMGDNHGNAIDSRYWGFLGENTNNWEIKWCDIIKTKMSSVLLNTAYLPNITYFLFY